MFDKIVVTDETAWTLAAGPIPPVQQNVGFEDAVDLEEGSGDSDEVNVIPTQTGGSSEKRKKNTIGPSLTGKGKKVKVGGAAYIQKQLNHLCDAVESYTATTLSDSSKKNYETYLDTTEECMEMLLTLPGVEDGNELFMLDPRWNYENSDECEVEEENSDEDEMEEQAIEQRDKLAMGARDIGNSK
ncbi:hypothetical protein SLEP1_g45128 [Rubroshorea leprosula]|nr:hypothetical protein SLEP1_g45128 [Rubroshorea leprosula]